jgi:hypothetical protein
MATVITINRPDVVALIEEAAKRMTRGNKTEAVDLAMRHVAEGVDLTAPILDVVPDSETGVEFER